MIHYALSCDSQPFATTCNRIPKLHQPAKGQFLAAAIFSAMYCNGFVALQIIGVGLGLIAQISNIFPFFSFSIKL